MTEQEIIEGNKLIAKFMGEGAGKNYYEANGIMSWTGQGFRYHNSWDWLMPVVEKIAKIQLAEAASVQDTYYPRTFGMQDEEGLFMFRFNCSPLFQSYSLIGACWLSVVYFIKCTLQSPKS